MSGTVGRYGNYYNADINSVLGRTNWNREIIFVYIPRLYRKVKIVIWDYNMGGSIGDGNINIYMLSYHIPKTIQKAVQSFSENYSYIEQQNQRLQNIYTNSFIDISGEDEDYNLTKPSADLISSSKLGQQNQKQQIDLSFS